MARRVPQSPGKQSQGKRSPRASSRAKPPRATKSATKSAARRAPAPSKPPASSASLAQHSPVRARRMGLSPTETRAYREIFWQNVLREVLVSLIMLRMQPRTDPPDLPDLSGRSVPHPVPQPDPTAVLDGRLGLITKSGQRIPIAAVYPVFSASVPLNARTLTLSTILQSTVFQIHTPGGEVYTLPLHEVRGFHALTEELMDQLAASARAQGEATQPDGSEAEPFGFAAFTSMARGKLPADVDDNDDDPSGAD